VAVMSHREGIAFVTSVVSDCARCGRLIQRVLDSVRRIPRDARSDPGRAGAALCDIARASGVGIRIEEKSLPISREVSARATCWDLTRDDCERRVRP